MTDRDLQIAEALTDTAWRDWERRPIAGDASSRRYFRLRHGDRSVILMDAPPAVCRDTPRFVAIAEHLSNAGLNAPRILYHNTHLGVLVLTDLGPDHVAAHLQQAPADEGMIYHAAADLLDAVAAVPALPDLPHLTPSVAAQMLDVLGSHYCRTDIADLQSQMKRDMMALAPDANTLSLRDFHAENLIWRGDKTGNDRLGLLDFQDAFVAPAGYDLASLLRDARRDVSPDVAEQVIAHVAEKTFDRRTTRSRIALLGVQRNLRIMGVFARLASEQGKTRYLQFMPRVWSHILNDLADPQLARLAQAVRDVVPAPQVVAKLGATA